MEATEKNLYQVLGVPPTSTPDDLKRAYHKLLMQYHPDLHPDHRTEYMKLIRTIIEAYSVLKDPIKREAYDERLFGKVKYEEIPKHQREPEIRLDPYSISNEVFADSVFSFSVYFSYKDGFGGKVETYENWIELATHEFTNADRTVVFKVRAKLLRDDSVNIGNIFVRTEQQKLVFTANIKKVGLNTVFSRTLRSLELGHYREATVGCRQILEANPNHINTLLLQGAILIAEGKFTQGRPLLERLKPFIPSVNSTKLKEVYVKGMDTLISRNDLPNTGWYFEVIKGILPSTRMAEYQKKLKG